MVDELTQSNAISGVASMPKPAPRRAGSERLRSLLREWGSEIIVAVVIVVLGGLVGLGNPVFFSPQNLLNILQAVAVVGIAAIGATLVIVSGNLDLSVGSIVSLGGLMCAMPMLWGVPFEFAILIGVATGCIAGAVNGIIVTFGRVNSFIVTLGTSSALAGLALYITDRHPISMPDRSAWLGQGSWGPLPISVLVFVLLCIGGQYFLSRTIAGQRITAVGDNTRAAFLSGLPVRATLILTYVMAGGFAAFAGALQASSLANAAPAAGAALPLTIIAGVIIGGTSLLGGRGSIIGTLLGSILLGILSNAFILLRLNPEIQVLSLGLVIVLAALVDQWRMRRSGA